MKPQHRRDFRPEDFSADVSADTSGYAKLVQDAIREVQGGVPGVGGIGSGQTSVRNRLPRRAAGGGGAGAAKGYAARPSKGRADGYSPSHAAFSVDIKSNTYPIDGY